jgi:hypothetical protein
VAINEVIKGDRGVSRRGQRLAGVTADVSRATGDKGSRTVYAVQCCIHITSL